MDLTDTILSGLVFNQEFGAMVLPHLKKEYFVQDNDKGQEVILTLIRGHYQKYGAAPTLKTLKIELDNGRLPEVIHDQATKVLSGLERPDCDYDWLGNQTEDFCKKKALHIAIRESMQLMMKTENTDEYGAIQSIIQDALGVGFDKSLGHSYIEDAEKRFEEYQKPTNFIRSSIDAFNTHTGGGFVEDSMTVFMAPTGVGKSLFMCYFAADFLMQGLNVFYVSLEMPEVQIAQRIDAHLLDVEIGSVKNLPKDSYLKKVLSFRKATIGEIEIKAWPASSVHSGHIRHYINELQVKKGFKPDVIIVDYLGIMAAYGCSPQANSYEKMKNVAVEVRSLGQEFHCRVFTAVQVNRDGAKSNDFDMTDTSESWGIPHTADYFFGVMTTEELEAQGLIKCKNLKNRHGARGHDFLVGINKAKMKLYNYEGTVEVPKTAKQAETQKHADIMSQYMSANITV